MSVDALDALAVLIQTLRSTQRHPLTLADARRRRDALTVATAALDAAGERLGWALVGEIAEDAGVLVARLEAAEAKRQADADATLRATVAQVAAEADGTAVSLDGGPSDPLTGVADWLATVEAWAAGRVSG